MSNESIDTIEISRVFHRDVSFFEMRERPWFRQRSCDFSLSLHFFVLDLGLSTAEVVLEMWTSTSRGGSGKEKGRAGKWGREEKN